MHNRSAAPSPRRGFASHTPSGGTSLSCRKDVPPDGPGTADPYHHPMGQQLPTHSVRRHGAAPALTSRAVPLDGRNQPVRPSHGEPSRRTTQTIGHVMKALSGIERKWSGAPAIPRPAAPSASRPYLAVGGRIGEVVSKPSASASAADEREDEGFLR
ncbi:hypothetical protein GCM10010390_90410 [Streptomyces mordarskii]|uniref:Uncharacterized protein n=1 Tax=Streptomyces mordarskii TaxID=1226758 RepID=A0ABN1ESA4_9ACTN